MLAGACARTIAHAQAMAHSENARKTLAFHSVRMLAPDLPRSSIVAGIRRTRRKRQLAPGVSSSSPQAAAWIDRR
jgi:hypothetical protein